MAALASLHEAVHVAALHVHLQHRVALQRFAAHEGVALVELDLRHAGEGHDGAFGGADRDRRDRRRTGAELFGQPHRDVEAARAVDQRRHRLAADAGLHHGQDVVGIQPVARRGLAVDLDDHLRLALVGLGRQVGHAGHAADHGLELADSSSSLSRSSP